MGKEAHVEFDALDERQVIVINACFCTYTGLLCGEGCFGIMESATFMCIEFEFCLKAGQEPLGCYCCACRMVESGACIKVQAQQCCLVSACGFPADEEAPSMLAFMGLTCMPTVACCGKLGDITERGTGDEPAAEEEES